jgi:hypothetical protein
VWLPTSTPNFAGRRPAPPLIFWVLIFVRAISYIAITLEWGSDLASGNFTYIYRQMYEDIKPKKRMAALRAAILFLGFAAVICFGRKRKFILIVFF